MTALRPLLLTLCALAAAGSTTASAAVDADTILLNGRILTVDAQDRLAQAVALHDGRILEVGTDAQIRALAGAGTKVIDLQGRTATPGLIDTHAHIAGGGWSVVYTVMLGDAESITEVQRRVAARVATLKRGEWVQGGGWDEGKFAERRYVLAADLDRISPQNPVWLSNTTGHYGVANSAALALAGITADTPDPPAGTIDRDVRGKPTGVLKEAAQDLLTRHLPEPTRAEWQAGIEEAVRLMHREGMTGAKDPDITSELWDAYVDLARQGRLQAHVCTLLHTDPTLESVRANIDWLARLPKPPAEAARNLVSCGAKVYMDGSGAARTGWVYEDWYRDAGVPDTGNRGYPLIDPDLYREAIRLYTDAGVHVGTHAIGDRAIDWVVDTYAAVLKPRPTRGLRHSIIHANLPTDHAIRQMAALQRDHDAGYPETQGAFTWWIGDNYASHLSPARLERLNPYQSYVANGVRWGGGSDYDVTPLPARYGLWASVARETQRGTYGKTPFGTAQSVDARTALRSFTSWAAHQLFLDDEAGSVEVGKSADIAVWDRDPATVSTAAIKDMKCEMTIFRGEIVYRAEGSRFGANP
jgi:predicted amidohydrolase YtcJ